MCCKMGSDWLGNLNKSHYWIGCTNIKRLAIETSILLGGLRLFLSYVYIAQRCMGKAVGLRREAAGAIDLASTP